MATMTFSAQSYQNDMDMDICDMFQTLQLNTNAFNENLNAADVADVDAYVVPQSAKDTPMDDQETIFQDVGNSNLECIPALPSVPVVSPHPGYGCAYLQAISQQLHSSCGSTTGQEYLDVIHTHREIFFAFPRAHVLCARGFSDLARTLERREWRADRDSDMEAAAAFRYEAWMIAAGS